MNVVDRMAWSVVIADNDVNRDGLGNVSYIVHPHAVVSILNGWGCSEKDDPGTHAVAWGYDVLEDANTPESAIRDIDDILSERILPGIKLQQNPNGRFFMDEDGFGMMPDVVENINGKMNRFGKVVFKSSSVGDCE